MLSYEAQMKNMRFQTVLVKPGTITIMNKNLNGVKQLIKRFKIELKEKY